MDQIKHILKKLQLFNLILVTYLYVVSTKIILWSRYIGSQIHHKWGTCLLFKESYNFILLIVKFITNFSTPIIFFSFIDYFKLKKILIHVQNVKLRDLKINQCYQNQGRNCNHRLIYNNKVKWPQHMIMINRIKS